MTSRPSDGIALGLLLLLSCPFGCSEEPTSQDIVVARIDGEPIRLFEIERRGGRRLHRARVDVHLLLQRETERLIEERVLERAANERGVDAELLLQEAESLATPVSEAEVEDYLEAHPADVPNAAARPRIRYYLEESRRIAQRIAFLERLREAADVEILLSPPVEPRSRLDLTGAPSRGPIDAPITIVHFADLSAPDTARSASDLARLEREFPGKLRILHRSLPIERHELGLLTAQLAAVAEARGLFWNLRDRLIAAGGVRQEEDLRSIARELDLLQSLDGLSGDRDSLLRVGRDLDQARDAGVQRAPTLFVNGRHFMAIEGFAALRELVREELIQPE